MKNKTKNNNKILNRKTIKKYNNIKGGSWLNNFKSPSYLISFIPKQINKLLFGKNILNAFSLFSTVKYKILKYHQREKMKLNLLKNEHKYIEAPYESFFLDKNNIKKIHTKKNDFQNRIKIYNNIIAHELHDLREQQANFFRIPYIKNMLANVNRFFMRRLLYPLVNMNILPRLYLLVYFNDSVNNPIFHDIKYIIKSFFFNGCIKIDDQIVNRVTNFFKTNFSTIEKNIEKIDTNKIVSIIQKSGNTKENNYNNNLQQLIQKILLTLSQNDKKYGGDDSDDDGDNDGHDDGDSDNGDNDDGDEVFAVSPPVINVIQSDNDKIEELANSIFNKETEKYGSNCDKRLSLNEHRILIYRLFELGKLNKALTGNSKIKGGQGTIEDQNDYIFYFINPCSIMVFCFILSYFIPPLILIGICFGIICFLMTAAGTDINF